MRQFACPAYGAANRTPDDKDPLAAKCGRCGQPLCGPCRAMASHFEAAAGSLEPDVRLLKLNADADPLGVDGLGISGVPALVLFADGRRHARTAGLMTAAQIVAWTRQALAPPAGRASQGN